MTEPSKNPRQVFGPSRSSITKEKETITVRCCCYLVMGAGASAFSVNRIYRTLRKLFRRALTGVRTTDDESDEFEMAVVRYKPDGIDSLCKTTKFSKKELQLIYRGFKQECPSGLVDEDTFKGIYAQFFPQGDSSHYAHYIFRSFDQNKTGTINFEEFVAGLSILTRGHLQEKLQWAFNLYDLDGDGCVTRDELYHVISSIYELMGDSIVPEIDEEELGHHVDRVFQRLDVNRDGVLTIEEFMETLSKDEDIAKSMALFDSSL